MSSGFWQIFYELRIKGNVTLFCQSFGLLEKKSIKVTGIKDFSWSPTDNILGYWIAEDKDVPAKVSLISIPTREEVL